MNGSVVVNYSSAGADPAQTVVTVQIAAAQPDGRFITNFILTGGSLAMNLQ